MSYRCNQYGNYSVYSMSQKMSYRLYREAWIRKRDTVKLNKVLAQPCPKMRVGVTKSTNQHKLLVCGDLQRGGLCQTLFLGAALGSSTNLYETDQDDSTLGEKSAFS